MTVKEFFNTTLNILFPSGIKCFLCGKEVDENTYSLCDNCGKKDIFCTKVCEKCGTPVKSEANYCIICRENVRKFNYARAPLIYKDEVIRSIHQFKYAGKKYLAKYYAKIMLQSFAKLQKYVDNFDYIIPVPLHKNKLKQRGYNQSELIASEFAKLTNIKLKNNLVTKIKETPSQTNFTKAERYENLKDAFSVVDKTKIKGKNILIIDDVLTTGATTESLTSILKKAKANKVCVLAVARADIENHLK